MGVFCATDSRLVDVTMTSESSPTCGATAGRIELIKPTEMVTAAKPILPLHFGVGRCGLESPTFIPGLPGQRSTDTLAALDAAFLS